MEPSRLASLALTIRRWAFESRQDPQQVAHGMSVLTAAIALGAGVSREEFTRGAGLAYDDAAKRARAGNTPPLLVGPDGTPLG